jgi:hypothetical protein
MQNIGTCGLNCGNCEAYKATQAKNVKKLSDLATSWSSEKNKWRPEDMRCDGCTSNRVFKGCMECPVRACARGKGADICSRCGDYSCDKIQGLWNSLHGDVEAWKANLEKAK